MGSTLKHIQRWHPRKWGKIVFTNWSRNNPYGHIVMTVCVCVWGHCLRWRTKCFLCSRSQWVHGWNLLPWYHLLRPFFSSAVSPLNYFSCKNKGQFPPIILLSFFQHCLLFTFYLMKEVFSSIFFMFLQTFFFCPILVNLVKIPHTVCRF